MKVLFQPFFYLVLLSPLSCGLGLCVSDANCVALLINPPITVTGFSAVPALQKNVISWEAVAMTGTYGYLVVRSTSPVTWAPTQGQIYSEGEVPAANVTVVYVGTHEGFEDRGLTNGTRYYYGIFTWNGKSDYSSGSTGVETPGPYALAATAAGVGRLVKVGDYLFGIGSYSGTHVVDVSTPSEMKMVGHAPSTDQVQDMAVQGNYAVVSDYYDGYRLYDLTDPRRLDQVALLSPNNAFGAVPAIGGGLLFAPYNSYSRIQVYDISNPIAPVTLGSLALSTSGGLVAASSRYAYVGDAVNVKVIDALDPSNPVVVGSVSTVSNNALFGPFGSYVYALRVGNGFTIVDISNPVAPVVAGTYNPGCDVSNAVVVGTTGYLACGTGGLRVVDVSNPAAVGALGTFPGTYFAVAVDGAVVYLGGPNGYVAVDTSSGFGAMSSIGAMSAVTREAYLSACTETVAFAHSPSFNTLSSIRADSPTGYTTGGTLALAGVNALAASGSYGYAGTGTSLRVIDATAVTAPALGGIVNTGVTIAALAAKDSYVYSIHSGAGGLRVIDATNPAAPTVVGTAAGVPTAAQVCLIDDYALVAAGASGLYVVDVSNPATPAIVGTLPGTFSWIACGSAYAYGGGGSGSFVIDVSNPAVPVTRGAVPFSFSGAVRGDLLVEIMPGQLVFTDVSNPDNPGAAVTWALSGAASQTVRGVCVSPRGNLYVARERGGLLLMSGYDL